MFPVVKTKLYSMNKKIERALISVYHKDGLDEVLKLLHENGVEFLSTGGTASFIKEQGYPCMEVEELTGYPSILGGRVKTLHPKIFGGILARRDNEQDCEQMKQYGILPIDLVIVDLYPFAETVDSGATEEEVIEKIDIGGISLIRAAAKNYRDVVVIPSQDEYERFLSILQKNGAATTLEERRVFAEKVFDISADYDVEIYDYF
jgi:phosphoribosylaminoimidazolecarboxamide formyltransferase/IMP cyclohydrolase